MRALQLALLALLPSMLAVASAAEPQPAVSTPFNVNLVKNPGGAPKGGVVPTGYEVVPIPNWVSVGNFTLAPYGSGGFPELSESARFRGGKTFFSGGPDNPASKAYQVISLSGRNKAIDNGKVRVNVSAWLANYDGQPDRAQVVVQFLSASGQVLGTTRTAAVSHTDSKFSKKSATALAPAGTRKLKVILQATRGEGSYCDGYFDNIDVRVTQVG